MIQKIVQKDINSLIFAEYNPRQLSKDDYKSIKDSISRFGLVDPIIINKHKDRKNIIVGGHQRIRVAKDLKFDKVPCVEVDLPYDKERELNVRLNKNTGSFDFDILADMFDMDELIDWGFTEDDLVGFSAEEEKEGLIDDDEIPEDVESVCKLGDIWQLGEHRLLCGDSTKKENIELLLDGKKADMVFTDPPYGMNLDTNYIKSDVCKGNTYKPVIGDDKDFDCSFILSNFSKSKEIFLWGADYYCQTLPKNGSWIVWDKGTELTDDMMGASFELCWSREKHKRVTYRKLWKGITAKEKNERRCHPTQKPIDLAIWFFEKWGKDYNCIDPFLGSGSTLIACEKTNRKCYGMELDPQYCDVIINRWEQFTGKKAELLNGKTKEI